MKIMLTVLDSFHLHIFFISFDFEICINVQTDENASLDYSIYDLWFTVSISLSR